MRSLKNKFQRYLKIKMYNNRRSRYLKLPASVVRISTKLSRPPERYSPSLYYLLLTDSGEPECYEEAMQVDTKNKWESRNERGNGFLGK
jgi:hypothetical protein